MFVPNVPVDALPPDWQSKEKVLALIVTEGLATVTREASMISVASVPALIVWLKVELLAATTVTALVLASSKTPRTTTILFVIRNTLSPKVTDLSISALRFYVNDKQPLKTFFLDRIAAQQ